MRERQPKWYDTNPVMDWLRGQGLTVKQLALLADVAYVDAYSVVTGYYKTLPAKYQRVIDQRTGDGTGLLIAEAYVTWRHGLADDIVKVWPGMTAQTATKRAAKA
jgi:hypothetical protein